MGTGTCSKRSCKAAQGHRLIAMPITESISIPRASANRVNLEPLGMQLKRYLYRVWAKPCSGFGYIKQNLRRDGRHNNAYVRYLIGAMIFSGVYMNQAVAACVINVAESYAQERSCAVDVANLAKETRVRWLDGANESVTVPASQNVSGIRGVDKQSNSEKQEPREVNQPPFRRRIIVSLVVFILGYVVMVKGWTLFYRDMQFKGRLIAYGGIILWICAAALWLSSGFKWSWGWPV